MLQVDHKQLIEERLPALLNVGDPILRRAAIYSTMAPSKRIRPLIVLSIAGELSLDVACAIEMLHTYTLIHDDLPAMDDDDMRRGQPSLHIHEDEATAILTGDFLLTYAFELLSPYPDVVKCVAKKMGASGILGGQIKDLAAKQTPISLDQYLIIAKQKTGALFAAAAMAAGFLIGVNPEQIALLEQFGETFGVLFQMKDDLSDRAEPSSIQSILSKNECLYTITKLKSETLHLIQQLLLPSDYLKHLILG